MKPCFKITEIKLPDSISEQFVKLPETRMGSHLGHYLLTFELNNQKHSFYADCMVVNCENLTITHPDILSEMVLSNIISIQV